MLWKNILIFLAFFIFPSSVLAKDYRVEITQIGFEPPALEINVNDSVTFENKDLDPHWPASNIHPTHKIYPEFDPKKEISPNESWDFTFERAGEWQYHDHLFPEKGGVILVKSKEKAEKPKFSLRSFFLGISENLEMGFYKIYFHLFPQKFANALVNNNMHQIAQDGERLSFWLKLAGPDKVMEKLLVDSGGGSLLDCHQEAHKAGRLAYEIFGPSVFAKGDSSCHAGFYHGAMEAFLKERGTKNLAANINEVCNLFTTSFSRFECLHGVGHGVMAYLSYDLPKSLEICSQLDDDFAKSSCWGGVFMENIVAAQGAGALIGHETEWVNNDPHFPCNSIGQDPLLQTQCYLMQTSRMLDIFRYDFAKVSDECLKAPNGLISTCFQSLGRDAAGFTLRDPVQILGICQKAPTTFFDYCITGSLNVIIDFWGENLSSQPFELCRLLKREENKAFCYNLLGQRLKEVFANNYQKIRNLCQFAENDYKMYCYQS